MLEQIKKVVANGNQSGVVNSKIAVFKMKAKQITYTTFWVEAEDPTALFNILPLYWLVEHPTDGFLRLGNCSETIVKQGADGNVQVEIKGTTDNPLDDWDCYLVIANWPDNAATTDIERVI